MTATYTAGLTGSVQEADCHGPARGIRRVWEGDMSPLNSMKHNGNKFSMVMGVSPPGYFLKKCLSGMARKKKLTQKTSIS